MICSLHCKYSVYIEKVDFRLLENMQPKISVVMPVYNTEQFVAEAIQSILDQTFTAFEFIIVDDGCTDKSWEIISAFAKKDPRIKALQND